jgi:hypothetical protein
MQTFTYFLTDLDGFRSEPIVLEAETGEQAVTCGARIARELLAQMPDLTSRGMCVTVHGADGEQIYVVPIDPVH